MAGFTWFAIRWIQFGIGIQPISGAGRIKIFIDGSGLMHFRHGTILPNEINDKDSTSLKDWKTAPS